MRPIAYKIESPVEFPAELDQVSASDRITATFGWLPSLVGSLCLIAATFSAYEILTDPILRRDPIEYGLIAALIVARLGLLYCRPNYLLVPFVLLLDCDW